MEALLLLFDVFVLIAVFTWAIKNSNVGGPLTGLFRFKNPPSAQTPPMPRVVPRWRAPR